MPRFEELQMKMAESARNYLEIFNLQVMIEQFTLDREAKIFLTLPNMESPFYISAVISFSFDAFQTGMTIFEDLKNEEEDEMEEVDSGIEMDIIIKLPILKGEASMTALLSEIERDYPDTEPVLITREMTTSDETSRDYEISYSYSLEESDTIDGELFDEIFEELKDVMELIYKRTKDRIDHSWYRSEE